MIELRILRLLAGSVLLAGGLAAAAGAAPTPSEPRFEVQQRWDVGGNASGNDGWWDYLTLDASGQRLFVSRSSRVEVIDTTSGSVIGSIQNTHGVHGIALAPDLKRGFTSNGQADSLTVFDLQTLAVIQEVKIAGHHPDAILYEPSSKHVFAFNGKSKDVTILDASKLSVISTLSVPDKPEFAVDDGAGRIYVNIESDPGQMVVINSRKLTAEANWPLPGCSSPSGLAIDRTNHRLFSVCDGKVMVITDARTGRQVARVPIGDWPDAAAYDAKRHLVFSSNGDGSLTVVRQLSADRYEVAATVPTQYGARTMALDPASGEIYLVTAEFGPAPAPTPDHPHPRAAPLAGSFYLIVVGTADRAQQRSTGLMP
jgi:DNA-binding beta-propeller fold protein YncE